MIRPLDNLSEASDGFDPSPYISDLFTCTIKRLKAADIDQEVKERAISCMGQIICNLGNRRPLVAAVQLPVVWLCPTASHLPVWLSRRPSAG